MLKLQSIFLISNILLFLNGCQSQSTNKLTDKSNPMDNHSNNPYYSRIDTTHLTTSDAEWKKVLPADVYEISRNKGTERSFTGKYWDFEGLGMYYCAACGNALFKSDAKFGSGCGWPSSLSIRQKTLASCAFRNSAPSSASAADAATSLRMVHCTWMAPLSLMGSPSRGKLPRKK